MNDSVVLGALVLALSVQSAVLLLGFLLHLRSESAGRAERDRLINLVVANSPREFATLQKASAVKPDQPPEAVPEPEQMVGIGGTW